MRLRRLSANKNRVDFHHDKDMVEFHPDRVSWARGGVRSTRGLGRTMTARGQSIGISIGILPQTLIMSRLDQLSRLGTRILFFHYS
jgi:hypothetical protein